MPVAASYDHGRAKHDRAMKSSVGVGAIFGVKSSLTYWAMIAEQKSSVCETADRNGTVLPSMVSPELI